MSWEQVKATIDDTDWVVSKKLSDGNIVWCFPFASEIDEGGKFKSGGKTHTAISVENVADRNEEIIVLTKGVNDGKSKARGTEDKTGGEDV